MRSESRSMSRPSGMPRWPMLWRVAVRDLLATIRDRRTLNATIFMPLIMIPLLTLGLPFLMGNLIGGKQTERQKVGVIGTLPAPLRSMLESDVKSESGAVLRSGVTLVPVTDAMKAVQDGDVEAVLKPAQPMPTQAGGQTATLEVYGKLASMSSEAGAVGKVQSVVEAYNRSLTVDRLKTMGLDEQTLTPVRVQAIDATPEQARRSGMLAFLIPMLMLQFILSGGMATAVDATAGEKERGTLESLLVTPVRRSEVVGGKLLATTLTALISALFSVAGFVVTGFVVAQLRARQDGGSLASEMSSMMGGQLTLTLPGVLALLGIGLSSALLISALLIAISIYARSFKEAQTYIAPLSMLIVIPVIMLQFADFLNFSTAVYATPLIGSMIALLDTVKGTVTTPHALLAILGNLLGALLVSMVARRSFGREEIIFRN